MDQWVLDLVKEAGSLGVLLYVLSGVRRELNDLTRAIYRGIVDRMEGQK